MLFTHLTLAAIVNALVVSANFDAVNWGKDFVVVYDDGLEWGDRDNVKHHIFNACNGWDGNRGALQDVYYKPWNESPFSAKVCVNTWQNHVNFEIANLNPMVGFTLNAYDCTDWLTQILQQMNNGGEWQHAGWWVRVDPNAGNC